MGDAPHRAGWDFGLRHALRAAHNPELAIAGQAIGQHLLVPRLEDVKRLNRAREEDEGQGEKWEGPAHRWILPRRIQLRE